MQVVAVTAHPSHRYFVSGSADATWAFYDLERMARLTQVGMLGVHHALFALAGLAEVLRQQCLMHRW